MLDSAATPQPSPQPGKTEVYTVVINDILARVEAGKAKYGTTLQTHNGRSALWDLYQELIDACKDVRQAILEQEGHDARVIEEIEAFVKRVNARAEKSIIGGMVSGAHYNAMRIELEELKRS